MVFSLCSVYNYWKFILFCFYIYIRITCFFNIGLNNICAQLQCHYQKEKKLHNLYNSNIFIECENYIAFMSVYTFFSYMPYINRSM